MNEEIWASIANFPEYAASNLGNIKRLTPGKGTRPGRIIRQQFNKRTGYNYVKVRKDGATVTCVIHRLVAPTYLGNRPTVKHQCNHKNGIKTDNRVENLEWVTRSENGIHAYRLGLSHHISPCGEKSTSSKITEEIAQAILDFPLGYGNGKLLAKKYNISKSIVSAIIVRRTWKHLKSKYPERIAKKYHRTPKDIVKQILLAQKGYGTGRALSKKFGISEGAVSKIRHAAIKQSGLPARVPQSSCSPNQPL